MLKFLALQRAPYIYISRLRVNQCRLICHTNLQLPEEHPPHSSCSMSCRFENTHSRWPRITHAVHASTKMKASKTGIPLHRILKSLILNDCLMNVDFRLIFYCSAPWRPQGDCLIHYTLAMQRNNDNVTKKRTTPEAAIILIMVAWQPNRVKRTGASWTKHHAWCLASAPKHVTTALFCIMTQQVVIISYRRFGPTYR
jgi:hypothetical protein